PNIANIPCWDTHIWVHNPNTSKLNTRACEGQWIGFDAENGGHQVYLEDHQMVTVEHNISFERHEGLIAISVLISRIQQQQMHPNPHLTITTKPDATPENSNVLSSTTIDPLGPNFEVPAPTLRHLMIQQTESPYLRMLHNHEGTHGSVQSVDVEGSGESVGGVADASVQWELQGNEVAYAMFMGTCKTEALEPCAMDEARLQPNWPRWDEAIKSELKSLDDAHSWDIVEQPSPNINVIDCGWVFKIKKNSAGEIDKYKA
ncbi:hypothetical protein PAXRUDRAFT_46762, partial [Paxillus rubicundulus Ve08.2h10]